MGNWLFFWKKTGRPRDEVHEALDAMCRAREASKQAMNEAERARQRLEDFARRRELLGEQLLPRKSNGTSNR